MERLMPNLIPSVAEYVPIDSYIYSSSGLDGAGVYRVTRVVPEKNEVYGVLVEKEPLSKPWWHFNRDEGKPNSLPMTEKRHVPAAAKKKKRQSKKKSVEANRAY